MTSFAVSRMALTMLVIVVLVIGFAIGFLAGYLGCPPRWRGSRAYPRVRATTPEPCKAGDGGGRPEVGRVPDHVGGEMKDEGGVDYRGGAGYVYDTGPHLEGIGDELLEEINVDNIRDYLSEVTKQSRAAGTPGDQAMAHKLVDFFEKQGFDSVKVVPYNVLLSHPDKHSPNHVELYDRRDKLVFSSQNGYLTPDEEDGGEHLKPFFAYSARGSPKSDLVYVNYATVDDFRRLTKQMNIDVTAKICIARRGKIHTSTKVSNAERYGAAGLLIYTDPDGESERKQHISSTTPPLSLPDDVPDGSLLSQPGDPLTPGYPAIDSAYREPIFSSILPRIPVQPISSEVALYLMGLMRGAKVEDDWQGNMDLDYRYGPGFKQKRMKVQIKVSTESSNGTIHNMIGVIRGTAEHDRYVLISSQHDAWMPEASDSSSSTAILMELARAFGRMLKNGWRPLRSIVFSSWSGSDYGLIGSTEWVEHYRQLLIERAVAAINLDLGIQGNYSFNAEGTPLAHRLIRDVSKHIINPDDGEKSRGRIRVYDTWIERQSPGPHIWGEFSKPRILPPDPRSNSHPFISELGVTSINLGFISKKANHEGWPFSSCTSCSRNKHVNLQSYTDPSLKFHLALTRFSAELLRRLSDDLLLPYDVREYATALQSYVTAFTETHGHVLKARGMSPGLGYLQEAVSTFQMATERFSETLRLLNKSDPIAVRMINDRLLSLERAFIDSLGLPNRPSAKHVLYSGHDRSLRIPFPGLADSLVEARESTRNSSEKWSEVRRQLSILSHFIHQGAAVLKPVDHFF